MLSSEILDLMSSMCSLSIRLSMLDVPSYNMALKVFKAQTSLSAAQGSLNSILIELSNVPSPPVSDKKV